MTKRIFVLLCAVLILFSTPLTARAEELDVSYDKCSIQVELKYKGQPVSGGKLTCIRIAELRHKEDNQYSFYRLLDGIEVTNIGSASTAAEVEKFCLDNKEFYKHDSLTLEIGKNGKVKFENRQTGLYLIRQTTASPGFEKINSFLVSLPYQKGNGEFVYQVTSSTKQELLQTFPTEPTTTKPTKPTRLPQTGQLNWPVPMLAGMGMFLFAFGWMLRFRKKEENE